MAEPTSQLPRTTWLGLGLIIGLLGLSCLVLLKQSYLLKLRSPPVLGKIYGFTLTNQDAQTITLADLSNHVWIADIIFTRCAGPCPRMTAQMESLQTLLPKNSGAKLVTLTTDPDYDTPPVMKKYGERFNADFSRWIFLTGTKNEIANLGSDSLKLSAIPVKRDEQKNPVDLFIHTTIFVVVDKRAQLRGIFETGGEGVDWTNSVRPKLLATVRQLEGEK